MYTVEKVCEMKSLCMDLIRKVYGEQIFYKKKNQPGVYIPLSRSMRRYYKYRGRPLGLNGSR